MVGAADRTEMVEVAEAPRHREEGAAGGDRPAIPAEGADRTSRGEYRPRLAGATAAAEVVEVLPGAAAGDEGGASRASGEVVEAAAREAAGGAEEVAVPRPVVEVDAVGASRAHGAPLPSSPAAPAPADRPSVPAEDRPRSY